MNPLEKAAKLHFGVTDDLSETGYVLSDGTFLDFSGRHEANGYVRKGDRFVIKRGEDYLRYHRYVDHRMLPETITDKLRKDETHASTAMLAFMEATGAMRIMPGVGLAVTRMPTFESIDAFMRGWKHAYQADPVIVDILHPEGYTQRVSQEIEDPDVDKIVEFLEANFNSPSMGASGQKACLKCKDPVGPLDSMECGAFCENTFPVCSDCRNRIEEGFWARLCYECGGGLKSKKTGKSRRRNRLPREDEGGPWGENATRAREDLGSTFELGSMSPFSFFSSCPNWPLPVEDLDTMTQDSREISRKTFLKYVNPEEMREMERGLGYSPSSHLTMASDPYVAYFKSTVRGCPVVYFVWSAQEYVFGDLTCIMRT